jgi:transcriptional regulator of acetoin/glycerol metabolism
VKKDKPHGNSHIAERKQLLGAIHAHRGNINEVARKLKVTRQTVYKWIVADRLKTELKKARRGW